MEKAMVIRTDKVFQEKALNDAVKGLAKAYTNIEKNKKDACLILWRLEDGKKYEADGFKSLEDFAQTIGIEKSTAHRMADAGRVYDSKVPEIAQFASDAGYTSAAKLASMVKNEEQEKTLAESIKNGEITPDMTVDKISAWKADATAGKGKEKILPKYRISGFAYKEKGMEYVEYDAIEIELIPEIDGFLKVGTYDGERGIDKDGNIVYERWNVYASPKTAEIVAFTAEKVKKEKKTETKVKSIKDYSLEELEELLKLKRAEQA